jgi:transposase
MGEITIGIDIAKHVFQLHGVDAAGKVVLCRRLRRGQAVAFLLPCHPVWRGWKRAGLRTFGPVRSPRSDKCA